MDDHKQIHLLMVDDEEKFLTTLTDRLKLKLFDVTPATDGEEAIQACEKGQFDVAVVDLQMPGIDGVQLLKILKMGHQFLEVIILSGHTTIKTAVECTRLGAFRILEKPCRFEELVEAIKEAYASRLEKKFKDDAQRMEKLQALAAGQSALGILREMSRIDDTVK